MMKDINGVKFDVGDTFVDDHGSIKRRKVYFVEEDRILVDNYQGSDIVWRGWDAVGNNNFKIIKKRFLGNDKDGNAVHLGDECGSIVTGFLSGVGMNGKGAVRYAYGGWDWIYQTKLTKQLFPDVDKIEVTITKNGKPINETLSIETARKLKIID